MQKATLVLEGGATRGVFTSGVLDYLMEQEFYTFSCDRCFGRSLQCGGLCVKAARTDKRLYDPHR